MGIPLIIFGALSLILKTKKERSAAAQNRNNRAYTFFFAWQIFSWLLFMPGLLLISYFGEIPFWLVVFDFGSMPITILGVLIFALMIDRTKSHQQ